jgi:hypothetical protein
MDEHVTEQTSEQEKDEVGEWLERESDTDRIFAEPLVRVGWVLAMEKALEHYQATAPQRARERRAWQWLNQLSRNAPPHCKCAYNDPNDGCRAPLLLREVDESEVLLCEIIVAAARRAGVSEEGT